MSLGRLVFYSAVLAGWAAFAAWLLAEFGVLGRLPEGVAPVAVGAIVGAAIGAAVNLAAALGGGGFASLGLRGLIGFFGGAVGGCLGTALGNLVYGVGAESGAGWILRGVGWMLVGLGIGVIEGLQERSIAKIRNGLIGGALGGLAGGLLFDPLAGMVVSATGMSSRATAFVVLGLAIGGCIGLAQVVMRQAWLTVVDGYRPGRQLLLSRPTTIIGRAEHLPLPLIGTMNAGLAPEQLSIHRQAHGGFVLEDLAGGGMTAVNQQPIRGPVSLRDGDLIRVGPNSIRFNERRSRGEASNQTIPTTSTPPPPPPPPPPQQPLSGGKAPAPPRPPAPPSRPAGPASRPGNAASPSRSASPPPPVQPSRSPPPPPPPPPRPPK